MQPTALPAGKLSNRLLLIGALEIEAAQISARWHLKTADGENVLSARNRFPRRLVVRQRLTRLIDDRQLDGRADGNLACGGLFFSGDHPEQRRLARAVGTDDADDSPRWNRKRKIVDQ